MNGFYYPDDPIFFHLLQFYFFVVGSIVGSFLNVCIYRIPLHQSVIRPRSRCPHCNELIRWYQNIPIFSYIFLRGRCAHCRERISPVYPLVELLTALFFVMLFSRFGISTTFFYYAIFGCMLIILTFVDLHHRLLPAVITFPGIALGLLFALAYSLAAPKETMTLLERFTPVIESLKGAAFGAWLPLTVYLLFKWIRKKEALGHGDIVMLAMVGAFLGWKGVIVVLFLSSLVGSIVGIFVIVVLRKPSDYMFPFGTFIGAAALASIFWGGLVWRLFSIR